MLLTNCVGMSSCYELVEYFRAKWIRWLITYPNYAQTINLLSLHVLIESHFLLEINPGHETSSRLIASSPQNLRNRSFQDVVLCKAPSRCPRLSPTTHTHDRLSLNHKRAQYRKDSYFFAPSVYSVFKRILNCIFEQLTVNKKDNVTGFLRKTLVDRQIDS